MVFEFLDKLLQPKWLPATIGVLGFGAFLVWFLFGPTAEADSSRNLAASSGTTVPASEGAASPRQSTENSSLDGNSAANDEAQQRVALQEQQAKLETELKRAQAARRLETITKLAADYADLESRLATWNERVSALASSDSGRKIANDSKSLASVATLLSERVIDANELSGLASDVRAIEKATKEAISIQPDFEPSAAVQATIQDAERRLAEMRTAIERANLALSSFEKESNHLAPAGITLKQALAAREQSEAAAWAVQKEEIRKSVVQEAADKAAHAEAEKEKMELERKQALADAEVIRLKAEADQDILDAEAAATAANLEAQFNRDLPQILHQLSPLFAKGYMQPASPSNFTLTDREGPMSLSAIKKYGALDDGSHGYERFLYLFSDSSNDRTVAGPYPKYIGGALVRTEIEAVRPGYTLLKKYQRLLVDKGYLLDKRGHRWHLAWHHRRQPNVPPEVP